VHVASLDDVIARFGVEANNARRRGNRSGGCSPFAVWPVFHGIRQGLPFLDIKVVNEQDYSFFINSLFVRDRSRVPKA